MRILVILPTYNERENMERLCRQILKAVSDVHILVIDDNSPDGTGQIADELSQKYKGQIFAVHRAGKLGLGSAIKDGFVYAMEKGYDLVINMDCDFSHDPDELPRIIDAAKTSDLVIASRHVAGGKIIGWDGRRRFLHWLAQKYTGAVLGNYVHDYTNSFKAYRVVMLKKLPLDKLLAASSGYAWQHTAHTYYSQDGILHI